MSIVIRAGDDDKSIGTDGPHSSEGTRAVAAAIDEAVRILNYATMEKHGLVYPSDVYSVLGDLKAAVCKLPQALNQMHRFVIHELESGAMRENPNYGDHNGDTAMAVRKMGAHFIAAAGALGTVAEHLGMAQSATRGLEATEERCPKCTSLGLRYEDTLDGQRVTCPGCGMQWEEDL